MEAGREQEGAAPGVVGPPKHKWAFYRDLPEVGLTLFRCELCGSTALDNDLEGLDAEGCWKGVGAETRALPLWLINEIDSVLCNYHGHAWAEEQFQTVSRVGGLIMRLRKAVGAKPHAESFELAPKGCAVEAK